MVERRRLSGEERRASILKAARGVFAENGFRGTTTRALAAAAGVSEALLFKHFPSKEALFDAMQASYTRERDSEEFGAMMAMTPSTETLVRLVRGFFARLIEGRHRSAGADDAILARLMSRSLTEDGAFARQFLARVAAPLVAKIEACIPAAIASGDMVDSPAPHRLPAWFTHHLGVALMLYLLPDEPAVDYGVPTPTLIDQAVRFVLRGIGLKDEAIRRCYHPDMLMERRG